MPEARLSLAGPVLVLSGCSGGGGGSPPADLPDILSDATKPGETAKGAAAAERNAVEMAGIAVAGLAAVAVQAEFHEGAARDS